MRETDTKAYKIDSERMKATITIIAVIETSQVCAPLGSPVAISANHEVLASVVCSTGDPVAVEEESVEDF